MIDAVVVAGALAAAVVAPSARPKDRAHSARSQAFHQLEVDRRVQVLLQSCC